MIIKSESKFIVKRHNFISNLENSRIDYKKNGNNYEFYKRYGNQEAYKYGSNNSLRGILKGDILTLYLSSFGGLCGFEFNTEKILPYTVNNLGDLEDLEIMIDATSLLKDCVVREVECDNAKNM